MIAAATAPSSSSRSSPPDFDLLTYRKGRYPHIPRHRFQACRTRRDGQTITYVLADQEVRLLKGKLRLRQVTRLMENGHQTPDPHLAAGFAGRPSGLSNV